MSWIQSLFSSFVAHPWLFGIGLAAIAAPIIIHLLNRRRFIVVDWAAMRFLLDSLQKNRRRLRIEELLLLLLRCLILLLLALALARVFWPGGADELPFTGGGSATTVFVVDDSYSMGQKLGAANIYSSATGDLIERIKEVEEEGGQVAILRTSDVANGKPFFGPDYITDSESLVNRMSTLKPRPMRADLAATLGRAEELLQDKPGAKRVVVYSDFREPDLLSREANQRLRDRFASLKGGKIKVLAVDYGREVNRNLTIEKFESLNKYAVANSPIRVALTIRNNAPQEVNKVDVELTGQITAAGQLTETSLPVQAIGPIPSGESKRVEFSVNFSEEGPAVIQAKLPADDLPGDNQAELALMVRRALDVLIVDGHRDVSDPEENESYFIRKALDPFRDQRRGVKTTVVAADGLDEMEFTDYDAVMLLNVPEFPVRYDENNDPVYPSLQKLEDYVSAGGGLVIFTGDNLNLTFYNGPLFKNGSGLSPYRVGPEKKAETFFMLAPKSIKAVPILQVFAGEYVAFTKGIHFTAFTPVDESPPAVTEEGIQPPSVVARLADEQNSPIMATRQYGKGMEVLVYTSANKDWTDWPSDPGQTYPRFIHHVVSFVAKPADQTMAAEVGEPITFTLGDDLRDASAVLRTPDWPETPETALRPGEENANRLEYEKPLEAGTYTMTFTLPDQSKRTVLFSRNPDPAEGRLVPGHRDAIANAFGSEEFSYIDRTGSGSTSSRSGENDVELWKWAIFALIGLLALETFLAQRFGHYS